MNLVEDIHIGLPFPFDSKKYALVRGRFLYYHYGCDGVGDMGWGCGYRTLQTLCSWIKQQEDTSKKTNISIEVPSILDFQKALVEMGDKHETFIGSKQWIGSVEVAYCIDHFYKDPHYNGQSVSREEMQSEGWVKWQKVDDLDQSSFYNLCCPLMKAVT